MPEVSAGNENVTALGHEDYWRRSGKTQKNAIRDGLSGRLRQVARTERGVATIAEASASRKIQSVKSDTNGAPHENRQQAKSHPPKDIELRTRAEISALVVRSFGVAEDFFQRGDSFGGFIDPVVEQSMHPLCYRCFT